MSNPKVFVIPNDRDYERTLHAPLTFHAHYVLVPPSEGEGSLTSTNKLYPQLYDNGEGFARLAHTFPSGGLCPEYRLYRVYRDPTNPGQ